jgi:pyruvate dehydrogenase E1 component alpha subunit
MSLHGTVPPEPNVVQLLTPEGIRVEHPDFPLQITDEEIAELYRDLVMVRRFDSEATALQRQGELGLWASCLGQEAAQVGAGRAMQPQDMAFPTYREHGVAWCREVPPVTLLGLFRGTNLGGWNPADHNFNLYTIVLGAQTLHAVGYAMGVVRDGAVGTGEAGRDTAVLTFFGDGASSEGDVNEAFIWAASMNLPVVFYCQNNQWAISESVEHQTRVPLFHRAAGFGFPGIRIDGNDVLACLAVTRVALDEARTGQGPTMIEAYTYRMAPHTTSDDPTRYRVTDELETWRLRDPIERVRAYLVRTAGMPQSFFDEIEAESEALAVKLRDDCRALPDPEPLSVFDHVYAEKPASLARQQAEYAEYLKSFEGAH